MLAWLYWAITMGLFDRFKSDITTTQQGLTAGEWNTKGIALTNSNRLQEAIQCYDKALKIDPKDAAAWFLKGAVLNKLNRYQEALQCCDRALEIDPQNVYALHVKRMIIAPK